MRDAFTMYRVTGNLYLFLNAPSETMPPDELWIAPSHMMRPIPDGRSYIAGYEFTLPGQASEFIEPWKIVHLKTSNPANPFVGLSAIQSLALDALAISPSRNGPWVLRQEQRQAAEHPGVQGDGRRSGVEEDQGRARQGNGAAPTAGVTLLRGGDALQLIQASSTQKDMEFWRRATSPKRRSTASSRLASPRSWRSTRPRPTLSRVTDADRVWRGRRWCSSRRNSRFRSAALRREPVGEFEDMRQSNRILDLQEQAEYARYHTVNEVRSE